MFEYRGNVRALFGARRVSWFVSVFGTLYVNVRYKGNIHFWRIGRCFPPREAK